MMVKVIVRYAYRQEYDDGGYYEIVPAGTPEANKHDGPGGIIEMPAPEAARLIEASTVMREAQSSLLKLGQEAKIFP